MRIVVRSGEPRLLNSNLKVLRPFVCEALRGIWRHEGPSQTHELGIRQASSLRNSLRLAMDEIDIWRSAQQLIEMFGADAAKHAETRAQLAGEGARTGASVMLRVAAAVRELLGLPS